MQVLKHVLIPILSLLLWAESARAQADIYTVEKLFVAKTAANATEARDIARDEASLQAFTRLTKQITSDEDYSRLPTLSADEIARLIKAYRVKDEKISETYYEASFTISFIPEAVKNLLKEYEITLVENKGAPTLVLALYEEGESKSLWQGSPWHDAWIRVAAAAPIVIPVGDLDDVSLFDVDDVVALDVAKLKALSDKYEVQDVLIAEVQYDGTSFSGKPVVDVTLRIVKNGIVDRKTSHYEAEFEQTSEAFFDMIVKDTLEQLKGDVKNTAAIDDQLEAPAEKPNIIINISIAGLGQWKTLQQELSSLEEISEMRVLEVSPSQAVVQIFYKNNLEAFSLLLGTRGYTLTKGVSDDRWNLITGTN